MVPKVLADLHLDDREAQLDKALHDAPSKLSPPAPGVQRLPVEGLGARWWAPHFGAADEEAEQRRVWLLSAPSVCAALAGQGDALRAYVGALATRELGSAAAGAETADEA